MGAHNRIFGKERQGERTLNKNKRVDFGSTSFWARRARRPQNGQIEGWIWVGVIGEGQGERTLAKNNVWILGPSQTK